MANKVSSEDKNTSKRSIIVKEKPKSVTKRTAVHSEAQIMKLSMEFRKLQKELKFIQKSSYDYVKAEKEKVVELLKDESIPYREHLLEEPLPKESIEEEEMDLLLTNGKIDLDKVLCLHVFSVSQPFKCKKGKMEDPNVRINQLIRYSKYLPCYLVEPIDATISCQCWGREETVFNSSDGSKTMHLQVNSQIERMLHTVTNVLKNLNPAKLKNLSHRAQSVEQIQSTLEKPENQTFISSLLHSKFIRDRAHMRYEMCTVMQGKTHLIQDIGKFKKNLVFRLDVPDSLSDILTALSSRNKGPENPTCPAKDLVESSFEQLLQIKKHVGSNTSIIPGYQLLQKGASTGGIAVIDQTGTSVSYLAGDPNQGKKKKNANDITIIMQAPQITDHEYVIEKMSEMDGERMILARPRNRVEEVSLRIAKRNMMASKKIAQDDMNHWQIKEEVLKKLSNEERIAIAHKAAKLKNSCVNSKGESQSFPLAELLRGTVDRHSLLKLVRDSTDVEREVLFKPSKQGGMGIGELLMDKHDLNVMSRLEEIHQAKSVALVEKECNFRAPKKLNVGIDSQFGILKIEHEVSKKEIMRSCNIFERRLQKNK